MARPKFITKFLIPNLDDERFGPRLEWVDKKNGVFQLQWNHKSAHAWTECDAEVFTEWDKMKGRYEPSKKGYFSRSKQRFRALLYKFTNENQLRKLDSSDKNIQKYCIVQKSINRSRPTVEKEVLSQKGEQEEMMDFASLWSGDFNHTSDSEKENDSFPPLFKEQHPYAAEEKVPQLTDIEDSYGCSDVQWSANLPYPKFYPIGDLIVNDPPRPDVYHYDESHFYEDHENTLYVELIPLSETQRSSL